MMEVAIFTNLEESMVLGEGGGGEGLSAWPGPPAPVLFLMRVQDEAHGLRLRARLMRL